MKNFLPFFILFFTFPLISQDCITNQGGVFDAVTIVTGQDAGIGWDDCASILWEGTVEFVEESPDVFIIYSTDETGTRYEDMSMGAYYACYETEAQENLPNGDLRLVYQCDSFAITGASQWEEVYSTSNFSIEGGTMSFNWTNDYGEGAQVTLTRTDELDFIEESGGGGEGNDFNAFAGTMNGTAVAASTEAGIGWDECADNAWSGMVILEEESENVFIAYTIDTLGAQYEDMSFGAYYTCYTQVDTQDGFPNGDLRILVEGSTFSVTGSSQWDEVYTISDQTTDGGRMTFRWTNDYGEAADITLERTDGESWLDDGGGEVVDADGDGVEEDDDCDDSDAEVGAMQAEGTACDDGDDVTTDDLIQADGCTCMGSISFVDADADGVAAEDDCDDDNPDIGAAQDEGTACDDGNDETIDDVVLADGCTCEGELQSSTHELGDTVISIYPNPTNQFVNVDTDGKLDLQLNVYDLTGKLMITSSSQATIDLNELNNGIYMLEITDVDTSERVLERIVLAK